MSLRPVLGDLNKMLGGFPELGIKLFVLRPCILSQTMCQ